MNVNMKFNLGVLMIKRAKIRKSSKTAETQSILWFLVIFCVVGLMLEYECGLSRHLKLEDKILGLENKLNNEIMPSCKVEQPRTNGQHKHRRFFK